MKREIKFNAFIPALGIMLQNVTVYPDMIGVSADELEKALKAKNEKLRICDGGIYLIDDDHYDLVMSLLCGDDWYWIENNNCDVLQFSGYKDSNGNDLFVGHLLSPMTKYIGPMEIVIEDGAFYCKHKYNRWGLLSRLFDSDIRKIYSPFVIGSVYENPELLK